MGDTPKKVKAGDPLRIPAKAFNAFVDAARDFQNRARGLGRGDLAAFAQATIVAVHNDSAADRERFNILGLAWPLPTPTANLRAFQERAAFNGVTPSAALHTGKFCVLLAPRRHTGASRRWRRAFWIPGLT